MVGPTNVKPRRLSSLLMARAPGVSAGTSDADRRAGWSGRPPTGSHRSAPRLAAPPAGPQQRAGVGDPRRPLRPVPDDGRVAEEARHVRVAEPGDDVGVEPG